MGEESSHGLASSLDIPWGPYSSFSGALSETPRGHDTLLQVGLIFAPRRERLVHRNHMIGALRLVDVNG